MFGNDRVELYGKVHYEEPSRIDLRSDRLTYVLREEMVIVRGNVTLSPGNNSNFSGLLYVEGSLTVRSPCEFNGSIICTGAVTVQGAVDYATVNYDDSVLESLVRNLGNYRVSNTTYLPRVSK